MTTITTQTQTAPAPVYREPGPGSYLFKMCDPEHFRKLVEPPKGNGWAVVKRLSSKEAKEMLARHKQLEQLYPDAPTLQRTIDSSTASNYTRLMQKGRWVFNAQPIILTDTGFILDGRHRLRGLSTAGVTLPFLVVTGLDPMIFPTLDDGLGRTGGTMLEMVHPKEGGLTRGDGPTAASVLQRIWQVARQTKTVGAGGHKQFTPEVMFEHLMANPGVRESVLFIDRTKTRRFARQLGLSRATAAFVHWRISQVDCRGANEFFQALHTGANLHETHPILKLREVLEDWKTQGERHRGKHTDQEKQILITKAWNLYARGKECKKLYIRPTDTLQKPIPLSGVRKVRKKSSTTNGKANG